MDLTDILDPSAILKMSPPVLLLAGLNLVGWVVKQTPLARWTIPCLLLLLGAAVWPFMGDWRKIGFDVPYPVVMMVFQGLCIGGGAVGIHQGIKQWLSHRQENKGDTSFLRRGDVADKPADK